MLSPTFGRVEHVEHCGLPIPASDTEIWDWAKENKAIIVTNDEDFYYFSLQKGFPPKICLFRTGNQSTQNVKAVLMRHHRQIQALFESTQHGLLEIL